MALRERTLVTWTCPDPALRVEYAKQGLVEGKPYLYLGEIENMPGHGIFVTMHEDERFVRPHPLAIRKGTTLVGYHLHDFRELTEDEV